VNVLAEWEPAWLTRLQDIGAPSYCVVFEVSRVRSSAGELRHVLVQRRKKPPLPDASRLGVQSKTVLAKLGFDLRGYYRSLIDEPLPDEFRESINAISSKEQQTGDLITPAGDHLNVVWSRETGEPSDPKVPPRT